VFEPPIYKIYLLISAYRPLFTIIKTPIVKMRAFGTVIHTAITAKIIVITRTRLHITVISSDIAVLIIYSSVIYVLTVVPMLSITPLGGNNTVLNRLSTVIGMIGKRLTGRMSAMFTLVPPIIRFIIEILLLNMLLYIPARSPA
jgi:hypothetical protein